MLRNCNRFLICAALLATVAASSAFESIQLNGLEVDANTVIARAKALPVGRVQALSIPNGQIEYRSPLVTGLLGLRRNANGGIQALSVEQRAESLQKWINELKASGQFEYVEPNYIQHLQRSPTDLRFLDGTLWSLENHGQFGGKPGADISVTNAWDITVGDTNIIVAVVDSGVLYTHQDLRAQMWTNPGEVPGDGLDNDNDGFIDNVYGVDFVNNDGDPVDDNGHGTHVAGTIGAAANDGNPHVGIAWNVRLLAAKAYDANGSGTDLDTVRAVDFSVAHGAKIINASFGGNGYSQAEFDSVNAARSKGVLFVAAAGNNNSDNDALPFYPASFDLDNIISVAATDRYDALASFSNYGATTVHLGAPGVEIYSTYSGSDTDYRVLQGTSMATPHVSGVAALVAAALPGASYSEIKARILEGVTRIPSLAGKTITGGRLNAYRALTRGADGILEYSIVPANNSQITTGRRLPIAVNISDGAPVTNATVNFNGGGTNLVLRYDASITNATPSATAGSYTNSYQVPAFPAQLSFTLTAAAPGKSNLIAQINYNAVDRPSNDDFAAAYKVPNQLPWTHSTSNRLATIEGAVERALNHGGATNASSSLWYAFSVTAPSRVIVDTAGSTFDTVIGVYVGTTLATLEPVAQANDVGSRREAWVKFDAVPGVSYKIAIAGVPPSDEGTVKVRFELNGEPDTVAPILQITSPVSGITLQTNKAVVQGIAFDPQPNASGLPDAAVIYTVNTNQTPNPSQLSMTAQGTTNWTAPVDLAEGINFVRIWVVDNAENRSREQQIAIIYRPPLITNDLFISALPLSLDQSSVTNSNEKATKENGEPNHGANAGGKSIWYKFTPTQSGVFLVNTRGSTNTALAQPLDTVMSVYVSTNTTAPKVTTLDQLASNDDVLGAGTFSEIALTVEAGKTYYIAVDGYDAAAGTIQLNYAFNSTPVHQVTILPSVGEGTVTPRSGPFPANATVSVLARPAAGWAFQYFQRNGTQVGQNPLTFSVTGDSTVQAFFAPRTYAEDFEGALKLPFASTNWAISFDPTNQANHVFASTGNGLNRITNTTSVVVQTAGGVGGFDFGTSTETNYDQLEFYITPLETTGATNTFFLGAWSGESRGRYEFSLPSGRVRLEWRYVKDRAISAGSDSVFIDNIDLPYSATASVMALDVSSKATTVTVQGSANQNFLIEGSSDLRSWSQIGTARANGQGELNFSEPVKGSRRFYRFTPVGTAQ